MKKLLLLLCAFMASISGAWAQDTNLAGAVGVTAKIGDTDVSNVLTATGAQPNDYDGSGEMNIVVDLLGSKTIQGFALTFSGDRWVSSFTLSYSSDGSEYTKIADYETGRTAQHPETNITQAFATSITARYIKYTSKKSDKNVTDQYSETIKNFKLLQYGTLPAIPSIVSDSHKLGILSFDLSNATGYSWENWGSSTTLEAISIQGKSATRFNGFTYYGSGFTSIDATGYTTLHLDVYPDFTGTLAIFPITGTDEKGLQFNVTADQWNSVDLDIDDLKDLSLNVGNIYQMKYVDHVDANNHAVNGDGSKSFILGNVYLYGTPVVDTEKPEMSSIVVASTTHRSATLTVNATDNITTGKLTYTVKNSSDVEVGTGKGVQGEDVTITINGLTASTNYSAGDFKVTATDHAGNVSDPMNVPAFTTEAAPTGKNYSDIGGTGYEILVQARHYTNTYDYELIITSENVMTGFGNCYWFLNGGPGGTLMNNADKSFTDGGKTMTVRVRSTTAPSMDTPLYIIFEPGGEKTFKESADKNPVFDWVEIAGAKVYDVMVNGDNASVIGTISATNLAEFKTAVGNGKLIDLRNANIAGDIDELTTNNPNALFLYDDQATAAAATKTKNSVYTADVRYYGAPNGLTFVDDPVNVPLWFNNHAYANFEAGKSVFINRTIPAGSYATTYMAAGAGFSSATLETGLKAYELTAATTGQLTFTLVKGDISAGKGYVIYNPTGSDLTLTWQSGNTNALLDGANQGEVTPINYVQIRGTMQTITTDGTQWILYPTGSDTEIRPANGPKISPLRAYFTGVTVGGGGESRGIFIDGDVTKIGIIKANGTIDMNTEIYDLNGRRVQNPTKGIYIVNGKKVVIK